MTETTKTDLKEQIEEYENDLRRILINEGVDLTALDQQIADPLNHVEIQLMMISAVTGIPKRILTGSERGELASTQDRTEWLGYVSTRRQEFAEPKIVYPFVETCMEYGILPKTEALWTVKWVDLWSPSDKERVEIARIRAEALSKYIANPMAEAIVPPEAFLKYFTGLPKEDVELIIQMGKDFNIEEDILFKSMNLGEESTGATEE